MTRLSTIEGIGDVYQQKLVDAEIQSVEELLEAGKTPKGRRDLEESSGISGKLILEWVNGADLFRIKGVGEEYSDLLEAAGVDTVPELAQRNAENLYTKLAETNAEKHLVRRIPGRDQVASWVEHAKALPRIVTY